jgi:hypothetical protein
MSVEITATIWFVVLGSLALAAVSKYNAQQRHALVTVRVTKSPTL